MVTCKYCGEEYNPRWNILHGDKHIFAKKVTIEDANRLISSTEKMLAKTEKQIKQRRTT